MRAPHTLTLLLLGAVTIAACTSAPSQSDVQTAIAETQAANPTDTASPTSTQIPSATSTPTSSATPTRASTPTRTPTPTPLPPATQTAIARFATQTAVSLNATGTRQASDARRTATAIARFATQTAVSLDATATRQASNARGTATVQAHWAHATLVAQYTRIPWRDLVTYPDSYIGEMVVLQGWVFNVNGNQELQMHIRGTYEAVYVVMARPFSDIYEDISITVYGTVAGENCGTNMFGGEICQPLIIDAFYER